MNSTSKQAPLLNKDARRLAWARAQLESTENGDLDDARRQLLTRIRAERFVPEESLLDAYRTLSAAERGFYQTQTSVSFVRDEEEYWTNEVERYAGNMMRLPPDQRRERWMALYAEVQSHIQPRTRLETLWPGVSVIVPEPSDESDFDSRLAGFAAELFTLRPQARAIRREEILAKISEAPADWIAAAKRLKLNRPAAISSAPELFAQILRPPNKSPGKLRRQFDRSELITSTRRTQSPASKRSRAIYWVFLGMCGVAGFLLSWIKDDPRTTGPGRRPQSPAVRSSVEAQKALERVLYPERFTDPGPDPRVPYGRPLGQPTDSGAKAPAMSTQPRTDTKLFLEPGVDDSIDRVFRELNESRERQGLPPINRRPSTLRRGSSPLIPSQPNSPTVQPPRPDAPFPGRPR